MTKLLATLSITAITLAGCASQSSIGGATTDGSIVFTGQAIGKWREAGMMRLISNRGVICDGSFTYDGSNTGAGSANCSDGKIATFNFTTALGQGRGTGLYGNKPFTFNFVR